jgi:hypothetical protein
MAHAFSAAQFAVINTAALGAFGAVTLLAVLKRAANGASLGLVACTTAGNTFRCGIHASSADRVQVGGAGFTRESPTMTLTTSDGWVCIAVTKASGTVTPRFHKFVYAAGAASHEDANGTLADWTSPGPTGLLVFNRMTATGTFGVGATYEAVAIYDRALSDAEFESAAQSRMAMASLGPAYGLFAFDAAVARIIDLAGGGAQASHTGTVDLGGSPLSYGHPIY